MRIIIPLIAALSIWTAHTATAQDKKVVVELYTSQGCSSCPPADALLTQLAQRDDVIAMALHVDYWDYIGWKDNFADPAYTERQSGYARAAGKTMIYTPQMVIGGKEHVVGSKPDDVRAHISALKSQPQAVKLRAVRDGNNLRISAAGTSAGLSEMDIQLARYVSQEAVDIRRGENAGRRITYTNIVTAFSRVAKWDGRRAFEKTISLKGDEPTVVIVQKKGFGPILAAIEIR